MVLIGVALTFLWIVLAAERFFIKKLRLKKYNIELVAAIVTLPFEFFVVSVLIDFITNFRMIELLLQGLTAGFIIVSMLLISLWSAFSLERWHSVKRKLSGEEEDEIWIEEWVEDYEKADEYKEEEEEEDEYTAEEGFKEIDYST
jgi:hypothetical protein